MQNTHWSPNARVGETKVWIRRLNVINAICTSWCFTQGSLPREPKRQVARQWEASERDDISRNATVLATVRQVTVKLEGTRGGISGHETVFYFPPCVRAAADAML